MKCSHCGKDAPERQRAKYGNRCPICQHPFVTNPAIDGLTDIAIKSAVNSVSGYGQFYFTKEQLTYELCRRLIKKKNNRMGIIFFSIFFLIILAAKAPKFFLGIVFVIIFIKIISRLPVISRRPDRGNVDSVGNLADDLVNRWFRINPHEKLLTQPLFEKSTVEKNNYLETVSFERVLICQHNQTVDFFLGNLFHFHYACPILGGDAYPESICADMLQRLKKNPALQVFLLHDYSEEGRLFVEKIKNQAFWFGGCDVKFIDLGLNKDDSQLFSKMTKGTSAELALFLPGTLISMCGAGINENLPFNKISSIAAANSQNGYG